MDDYIKVATAINDGMGAINTKLQQSNTTTEAMHEDVKGLKAHFACDQVPIKKEGETSQQFIQRNRDMQHQSRKLTKLELEKDKEFKAEKKHNAQLSVERDAVTADGMVQLVAGELETVSDVDAKIAENAAYKRTLVARKKQIRKAETPATPKPAPKLRSKRGAKQSTLTPPGAESDAAARKPDDGSSDTTPEQDMKS